MANGNLSDPGKGTLASSSSLSSVYWLSFVPLLGSLAIVREGSRLSDHKFVQLGWGVFALSLALTIAEGFTLGWLLQIGLAIWLRWQYTQGTTTQPEVVCFDINSCSKHELVRGLGMPIVYANDIDLIRSEGYLFTHLEELTELAGIPEPQVKRWASQLIFAYDLSKTHDVSWRRVNVLSAKEMESYGLLPAVAEQIVTERTLNGSYQSAVDIKKRTGLSLLTYQQLL